MKIGCIVNDVANVNIDAKLIRNNKNKDRDPSKNTTKDLADTIELANGCACEWPLSCAWLAVTFRRKPDSSLENAQPILHQQWQVLPGRLGPLG